MITLQLGSYIEYLFEFEPIIGIQEEDLGANPANYQIVVDLIPTGSIIEHELPLHSPDTDKGFDHSELLTSIRTNGFLDPILVTQEEDSWIIADGTHRLEAMRKLAAKWIPAMLLHPKTFRRDAWVRLLPEEHTEKPFQCPDGIIQQELGFFFDLNKQSSQNFKKKFNEIFKDQKTIALAKRSSKYYLLNLTTDISRLEYLRMVKKLDQMNDSEKANYIALETAIQDFSAEKWIMFSPPNDATGDIYYLAKYQDIRRKKGSRTILPWRIIRLPVPLEILVSKNNYLDIINEIENIIDQLIKSNKLRIAFLSAQRAKKIAQNKIGPHLFNQYLLIMDIDYFWDLLDQQERSIIKDEIRTTKLIQKRKRS